MSFESYFEKVLEVAKAIQLPILSSDEWEQVGLLEKCLNCGICTMFCPVMQIPSVETYHGPRSISTETSRHFTQFRLMFDEVMKCTLCGECREVCPQNVPVTNIIKLVRGKILEYVPSILPSSIAKYVESLKETGLFTPPMNREEREEMYEFLDVPVVPDRYKRQADVVYFPGCQALSTLIEIVEATKTILEKLDVNYTLLESWSCCGYPAHILGMNELAEELVNRLIDKINEKKAKIILTTCAGCTANLKRVLEGYDTNISVKHLIEYLIEDIKPVKLIEIMREPHLKEKITVTIHYPCELNRHVGKYMNDYLHNLVESLPNVKFVESKKGEKCCGGGGILLLYDSKLSLEIAKLKAKDFKLSGSSIVLTACPSCITNINRGIAEIGERNLRAKDISAFIAKNLK